MAGVAEQYSARERSLWHKTAAGRSSEKHSAQEHAQIDQPTAPYADYNDLPEDSQTIIANYDNFDLATLVRQSIQHDSQALNDDLFSLSPLSSPDTSPSSSPKHGTISFPSIIDPPHRDPSPNSSSSVATALISDRLKSRKEKGKARSHRLRSQRRRNQQASQFSTLPNPAFINRHPPSQNSIHTSMDTKQCATTKSGFIAQKTEYDQKIAHRLEDFIGEKPRFEGFRLERWDGRTSKSIYDSQRRLVAVLGGRPADRPGCLGWDTMMTQALQRMRHVQNIITRRTHRQPKRQKTTIPPRWGDFFTLRCGVSYGGAVFATWAPKLHDHYVEKLGALYEHNPSLRRPFSNSVFAAATYNLGPRSICFPHTDFANLAFGWCAVVSLGDFDPIKGGHLVLFQCRLVIEFPPGSLILFPSAAITHANTDIQDHEERFSFTQYSAGGLFRWVEQGFKTVDGYLEGMTEVELKEVEARNSARWQEGLDLLPRIAHLNPPQALGVN